jgi:hypothetical protein
MEVGECELWLVRSLVSLHFTAHPCDEAVEDSETIKRDGRRVRERGFIPFVARHREVMNNRKVNLK